MGYLREFRDALGRKKRKEASEETKLARVLNVFDLTALGVGSTLGLGVYVLAGSVAYKEAGPAVVLSFLIAAIASAFASICYAEFAARVPRAGSAYVYSYVSVGEFVAFTIGWNLILEYVIGASSVARGLSTYIDALIDYKMRDYWRSVIPVNVSFLAEYPDILSFSVVMILSLILALGVKESSIVHTVFTSINMCTILLVIISGCIKINPSYWFIDESDIPENITNAGTGGFMPYGFSGVLSGAATCFYGFIGFDCVATAGEEAKNPKRTIPLAIIFTCIICVIVYILVSTVLTMLTPYYLLDPGAPFTNIFESFGWTAIKWIVSIGAIFALFSSLLGSLFSLPRILYAMSFDGVIYRFLSKVNARTRTPVIATIIAGFLSAILAAVFSLDQLVDMLSIGTLLAYSIVALCVMILRYDCDEDDDKTVENFNASEFFKQLLKSKRENTPTNISANFVKILATLIMALSALLSSLLSYFPFNPANITLISIVSILLIFTMILIFLQPVNRNVKLAFKVPLVPLVPTLSIFINIYLMMQLDAATWIRFGVWIVVGFLIYFSYGMRKSAENKNL